MSNTDARDALRTEIRMSWDDHDLQGSTLGALGAICDVLAVADEYERIPASAGYRPGAGGPYVCDYPGLIFEEMLDDEVIDLDALEYWARVLCRMWDLIPEDRRY